MERPLPGVASVAIQQGKHAARIISADLDGRRRTEFRYVDKGQMATIGRRRAVMQKGNFRSAGVFAWLVWLLVHIYFLSGFRNRLFVLIQWSWSYLTFARGTRLIVEKEWRSFAKKAEPAPAEAPQPPPPATEAARSSRAPESARPAPTPPLEISGAASVKTMPPRAPAVAEEPVTRTWQAPSPTDVWEEPTTLYPSRD